MPASSRLPCSPVERANRYPGGAAVRGLVAISTASPAIADSSEPASTPMPHVGGMRGVVEGQRADEQAHGEADAAQHADAES